MTSRDTHRCWAHGVFLSPVPRVFHRGSVCGTNDPEATLLCVLEKPELTGELELTAPGWDEFPETGQRTESKSVPPEGSSGTGAPASGKVPVSRNGQEQSGWGQEGLGCSASDDSAWSPGPGWGNSRSPKNDTNIPATLTGWRMESNLIEEKEGHGGFRAPACVGKLHGSPALSMLCKCVPLRGGAECAGTLWALDSVPRSRENGGGRVPEEGAGIGPEGQVKETGLLFGVISEGVSKSCFLSLRERGMSKFAFMKDYPTCNADSG